MIRTSRRAAAGLVAIVVTAPWALGACSSGEPSTASTTTAVTTKVTTTVAVTSTLGHVPAGPVEPAFIPRNFVPLSGSALDVAVAVPGSWQVTTVDSDEVTSGGAALSRVDPQLGGLIRQVGGYLGNSAVVVAINRAVAQQGRAAMLVQSRFELAVVPMAMVSKVQIALESIGATVVRTSSQPVTGLADDARAVRIDAVLPSGASTTPLVVVLVPATRGVAVVVVRSPTPAANAILNTLAAR